MVAILITAAAVANLGTTVTPSTACLAGQRQAMVDGRFTGPLICSRKDATFRLVGRPSGSPYTVYDYRYRFLPHPGGVMHGGQKLIVFRRGIYVGQYALSPPPYTDLSVSGSQVVLRSSRNPAERLDFSSRPPASLTVDGETEAFHR